MGKRKEWKRPQKKTRMWLPDLVRVIGASLDRILTHLGKMGRGDKKHIELVAARKGKQCFSFSNADKLFP